MLPIGVILFVIGMSGSGGWYTASIILGVLLMLGGWSKVKKT